MVKVTSRSMVKYALQLSTWAHAVLVKDILNLDNHFWFEDIFFVGVVKLLKPNLWTFYKVVCVSVRIFNSPLKLYDIKWSTPLSTNDSFAR